MAAIAGALSLDSAPAFDVALRLAGRMQHRSPDGISGWNGGSVALVYGALHTGLASQGQQPLRLADGSVLVVDGRIDDRPALCAALGLVGDSARGMLDAALFGAAWLRWREDLWRHLVGDYAIAVWEPATARLTLVRDRVGVRPLYWACHGGWFTFASEPEALLAAPGAAATLNMEVFASLFAPQFDAEDLGETVYAQVRRVLAGEAVELDAKQAPRTRRYWTFADLASPVDDGPVEHVREFRAVFDEAVRCRLEGAHNPALMLSGGIDSASIHASAMAQHLDVRRVSVVAEQWNASEELSNIEAMLAQSPSVTRLSLPDIESLVDVPRLVDEMFLRAHPILASIGLPMLVNQAAAAAGSRVMLDGIDGDLALHAPGYYVGYLAREGRWRLAVRESRRAAQHHTYLQHLPAWRVMARSVGALMAPAGVTNLRDRLASARLGDSPFNEFLHPDLVASLRLRERTLRQRQARRHELRQGGWRGYRTWLWGHPGFMRGMAGFDMAAARWGLEARHPWADVRVLTLIGQLPLDALVRDGWTKHVVRMAYAPELGHVAWHSGKAHLGPQVNRMLLKEGRNAVDAALLDRDGVLQGLINPAALHAARHQWQAGPAAVEDIVSVLVVATLQAWLSKEFGC